MAQAQVPSALFLTDNRPGWVFTNIANVLSRELAEFYTFKTVSKVRGDTCDLLISLWWGGTLRALANTRPTKGVLTVIYDHVSWTKDDGAKHNLRLTIRNSTAVGVCNSILRESILKEFGSVLPQDRLFLLEDGVDTQLFRPMPLPAEFTIGWTGSTDSAGGIPDFKGLGLIKEAAKLAGVRLRVLDAAGGGAWPHDEMPQFYKDISVIVIGSLCEGTPNPLLEGMACGRPAISTRVGLAPDCIEQNTNGLLVDRNVESMAAAFKALAQLPHDVLAQMGQAAAKSMTRYTWQRQAKAWHIAMRTACVARTDPDFVKQPPIPQSANAALPMEGRRKQAVLLTPSVGTAAPALTNEESARSNQGQKSKPRRSPPELPIEPPRPPKPVAPMYPRLVLKTGQKPKYLLMCDVPGWAFDVNMEDMKLYLNDRFDFDTYYVIDFYHKDGALADFGKYHGIYCLYHRWPVMQYLPFDRTVGSLRSSMFKPETGLAYDEEDIAMVKTFKAFHVVTKDMHVLLSPLLPDLVYLTNPVNMKRFNIPSVRHKKVIASWNGNARHASGDTDVKGFYTIVKPACESAGVPLEYVEYHSKKIPYTEMPQFYTKANLAVCASLYEGASNSVMEAMASGQALIATDAGNHIEMRDKQLEAYGKTGIKIVPRDVGSFVEAIEDLKDDPDTVYEMGQINHESIKEHWSWDIWADRYAEFIMKAI